MNARVRVGHAHELYGGGISSVAHSLVVVEGLDSIEARPLLGHLGDSGRGGVGVVVASSSTHAASSA